MSPSHFTLVFDESGSFEEVEAGHGADVIGGLIVPADARSLEHAWNRSLRPIQEQFGAPLHANSMPLERRREVFQRLGSIARDSDARWLFLIDASCHDASEYVPFARYMRMLDAYVDLAARLAGAWGVTHLDVRPAQRTLKRLDPAGARKTEQLGLAREAGQDADGTRHRGITEADVRVTLELLGKEGDYPALASVEVVSATADARGQTPPHPGLALADFGCNSVLSMAGNPDRIAQWPHHSDSPPMVVSWKHLPAIRALDRALREPTPSLLRASMAWAGLVGNARITPERWVYRADGAGAVAEEMLARHEQRLAAGAPAALRGIARRLALEAQSELDAKTGAYEGVWRALQTGWAGESHLAKAVRGRVDDLELAGLLWRLTLECANHRGDVVPARNARDAFTALAQRGTSLAMLAEMFRVRNLWCVTVQNQLSAPDAEAQARMDEVLASARDLLAVAEEAGALVEVVERLGPGAHGDERPDPVAAREDEALWRDLGKTAPVWKGIDCERGRCLGTVARSYAFAGQMDEAIEKLLQSRLCFGADSFERGINATVLCRVLLERARLTDGRLQDGLEAAWAIAGIAALYDPRAAVAAIQAEKSARFRLDVLFRGLLWAPKVVGAEVAERWTRELRTGSRGVLFALLSSGDYVSHPTELIARHAGELVAGPAAMDWFGMSIRQSAQSADGTIRVFGEFTAGLRDGTKSTSGTPGSVLNPTFEYR